MVKKLISPYKLIKRYNSFSGPVPYLRYQEPKTIRYGYKFYQKIFRRYRSSGRVLRINVRKPRIATKRKTLYGRALAIKQKFIYLLSGLRNSKLRRYIRLNRSKCGSSSLKFSCSLESRLDVILYRTNIFAIPRFLVGSMDSGDINVPGFAKTEKSFKVPLNRPVFISLGTSHYSSFLGDFRTKVSKGLVFQVIPAWLEVDYKLHTVLIFRRPRSSEIFFPFDFDTSYFYRIYPKLLSSGEIA
jgi:ribosomal protein S4